MKDPIGMCEFGKEGKNVVISFIAVAITWIAIIAGGVYLICVGFRHLIIVI